MNKVYPAGEWAMSAPDLNIDWEAPSLPAYRKWFGGNEYLCVWCKWCKRWHSHGFPEGHRHAHCSDKVTRSGEYIRRQDVSPYVNRGYNIFYQGEYKDLTRGEKRWGPVSAR